MSKENNPKYRKQETKYTEYVKSKEFPPDYEHRLGTILNCVNNEAKAVTLMYLDRNPKSTIQILSSITPDLYPEQKSINERSIYKFIVYELGPSGFITVDRKKKDKEGYLYFGLTEEGEKYAQPIAKLAVKTVVDEGISMRTALGYKNYPNENAATLITNFNILKEISSDPLITPVELSYKVGCNLNQIRKRLGKYKTETPYSYIEDYDHGNRIDNKKYVWLNKNPENLIFENTKKEKALKIIEVIEKFGVISSRELEKIFPVGHKITINEVLKTLKKNDYLRLAHHLDPDILRVISVGQKFAKPVEEALNSSNMEKIEETTNLFKDREINKMYINEAINLYEKVFGH